MSQHTFQTLTGKSPDELEQVLAAGSAPALSSIVGWEFRGWNVFGDVMAKAVGTVMGIQRFAKGFFVRGGAGVDVDGLPSIEGYNVKIQRGTRDDPWTGVPDDDHLTRHSFYKLYPRGTGENRLGRYPNALFLDYSLGVPANNLFTGSTIKDFLVQVDADNPDLLLGKAFTKVGPVTNVGYFVLERLRKVDFQP